MSPALQQDREQRTRGTGAEDANRSPNPAHRSSARDKASTAANTSLYEL